MLGCGGKWVSAGKETKCPLLSCHWTPSKNGHQAPHWPGEGGGINSWTRPRDKKCYLLLGLSVGRWALSGAPPAASIHSCEEKLSEEGGKGTPWALPSPGDAPSLASLGSTAQTPSPAEPRVGVQDSRELWGHIPALLLLGNGFISRLLWASASSSVKWGWWPLPGAKWYQCLEQSELFANRRSLQSRDRREPDCLGSSVQLCISSCGNLWKFFFNSALVSSSRKWGLWDWPWLIQASIQDNAWHSGGYYVSTGCLFLVFLSTSHADPPGPSLLWEAPLFLSLPFFPGQSSLTPIFSLPSQREGSLLIPFQGSGRDWGWRDTGFVAQLEWVGSIISSPTAPALCWRTDSAFPDPTDKMPQWWFMDSGSQKARAERGPRGYQTSSIISG